MSKSTRCKTLTAIATGLSAASGSLHALEASDILVYSKEPFLLQPRLALSETYNDNIFSRPDAKDDFVSTVSPGLNFRVGKETGNFISLDYTFDQHFYAKQSELNSGEHRFLIRNKLQGQKLLLLGSDRIEFLSNPIGVSEESILTNPRPTTSPVQNPTGQEGGTPTPNPSTTPATIDPGSPIRGGEILTTFEERNVDYTSHYHSYNLGYALSEKTGVYAQGQYSSTDYEKGVGLYDLDTWRATGGFALHAFPKTSFVGEVYYGRTDTSPNFTSPSVPHVNFIGGFLGARGNFTQKLTGQVKVGYESREYSDDTDAPSSPVVDVSLGYRFSEKTTASLAYARLHDVSVQFVRQSYTANVINAQLSQLLGSSGKWHGAVGGSFGTYEYEGTATPSTKYNQYSAYFNLDYQIQLWLSARFGYSFVAIRSDGARLADYDVNRVTLGLVIGY